ncbi:sensor histidine kinase [Peptostreptococcus equinus]|uniref:ATP-binding protein n=1 Tax=Peptostreptococcus equinus TaxID=3003601 RepID=A0ABY7JMB5_9FIRM|nr:ATP-binding protein [Peptostreptococcus sp. CBA3647]WAW14503.1 ATP-binding protein [Peptostreptococcus sp. CBA3647]
MNNELKEIEEELNQKERLLKNKNSLIMELRKSNHDNKKNITLLNRLEENYDDIDLLEKILNSYQEICDKERINYSYSIDNNIKSKFIPYLDFNIIITNLIDNSINALEKIKKDFSYIRVNIFEDDIETCINIINNGPEIKNTNDIFHMGTSSSLDNSHGFGMNLVKEVIEKHNGSMIVNSNSLHTSFTVILPKF